MKRVKVPYTDFFIADRVVAVGSSKYAETTGTIVECPPGQRTFSNQNNPRVWVKYDTGEILEPTVRMVRRTTSLDKELK